MLKILQICNKAPFPANDGSSIAIYNMAKGLLANNVELHLLTINTKKHFKPDEGVPAEFRESAHYASVFRNTNTSPQGALMNLLSARSYFVSRFYFKAFEEKLVDTLNKNKFDIVQLEGLFMGVYIDAIKKNSGARIVLRAHNVEHFIWHRHIPNEKKNLLKLYLGIQNRRLKKFELNVISRVDAVVPITATDGEELKKLGCAKPMYPCLTGVDVKEYMTSLKLPEKAKTIFYFGSMDWLPNQEAVDWFLGNCWETVHKAVPSAKFIIAGRGMPLEYFHITRPNVLIVENVENGKAFYQQHQLMIVPLWSGSGLRIKIIEGMSYGKPIVSTTVGAEGIPCKPGENIMIADSPADFSKAVIDLLNNDEKRHSLGQHASAFALEEFDNFKVVSGLIRFYGDLLNV